MEATRISNPGEPVKAVLREGTVLVIALRLGLGEWEPLYAIRDFERIALPQGFYWSIEALGVLELAFQAA